MILAKGSKKKNVYYLLNELMASRRQQLSLKKMDRKVLCIE